MSDIKLKPVDEMIQVWDGYRGNNRIGWKMEGSKRLVEVFGTWCVRCLTNWGWTPDPAHADRIHRAMAAKGCPRCDKGGPPKFTKTLALPTARDLIAEQFKKAHEAQRARKSK